MLGRWSICRQPCQHHSSDSHVGSLLPCKPEPTGQLDRLQKPIVIGLEYLVLDEKVSNHIRTSSKQDVSYGRTTQAEKRRDSDTSEEMDHETCCVDEKARLLSLSQESQLD